MQQAALDGYISNEIIKLIKHKIKNNNLVSVKVVKTWFIPLDLSYMPLTLIYVLRFFVNDIETLIYTVPKNKFDLEFLVAQTIKWISHG